FGELFSNAPHFADALRIVLVNRLCEHNSQLISKLLFARQPASRVAGLSFFPRHCFAILSSSECPISVPEHRTTFCIAEQTKNLKRAVEQQAKPDALRVVLVNRLYRKGK